MVAKDCQSVEHAESQTTGQCIAVMMPRCQEMGQQELHKLRMQSADAFRPTEPTVHAVPFLKLQQRIPF